ERLDLLFSPVAELRWLSGPDTTLWIDDPAADVGNASSLAATALAYRRDGVLAYVIRGRFEHVNFIWRPAPLPIGVTDVIPPHPPPRARAVRRRGGRFEWAPPAGDARARRRRRARAHGGPPRAALPAALPRQRRGGRPGDQLPGLPSAVPPRLAADRL